MSMHLPVQPVLTFAFAGRGQGDEYGAVIVDVLGTCAVCADRVCC